MDEIVLYLVHGVGVMETTFCETEQGWIQLSAENTPTGAVPEMGEDGI